MKTVRTLCCTLRRMSAIATLAMPLLIGVSFLACDDENDPKTWVKRLDDPAQRANSIKRLTQFFEDDMTKASNNASSPAVKELLDTIIDPLTKQYTAGGLDDKTRTDLVKFLAETHDPRTQPALAKALKDFEMGKTDDEVRVACESIIVMVKSGTKPEQTVVDELWNVFARFRLSKASSQRLYQALHDAVVAVHDPSYGDKAIEKLGVDVPSIAPETVDLVKDQINWWQLTAIQVISELRYTKAIPQLVMVLLTPNKSDLIATTRTALLKMPKAAEVELIKALNGQEPYAKAALNFKDKANLAIIADVLALLSRPAGRDAILAALPTADTDTTRAWFAQALVQFPEDARVEPAFMDAYKKLTWTSSVELLDRLKPRAALAQASANFYDAGLTDWLVKETAAAPDVESKLLPLESAFKVMPPTKKGDVSVVLQKVGLSPEYYRPIKQMYDYASQVLDKCGATAGCYVSVLDEPIPSSPKTANFRAIKAAWMAVIYGEPSAADATRHALLSRVDKVKDAEARLAVVEAIDELAPKGDLATADALDKIVAADTLAGDKNVLMADDSVVKVALRLRARAAP
jgi:hypothetical protein